MSSPADNRRAPLPPSRDEEAKHIARLREAQAHFRRGAWREAEEACTRILRKRPSEVDALFLLAAIRHAQDRLPEALDVLARALKSNPRSPELLINHGLLLAQLGRRDEALASYAHATALRPDFAEA